MSKKNWASVPGGSVSWNEGLPTLRTNGCGCCAKVYLLTSDDLDRLTLELEEDLKSLRKLQASSRRFSPLPRVEVDDWDDAEDKRRELKKQMKLRCLSLESKS